MPKSIGLCLFWVMASFLLHAQGPQLEWAKAVGGNLENTGKSIAVDHWGNVYSTGYFQGTADMDPGPGIVNLSAVGNQDLYILKLDPTGNFLWVKQIGSTADDFGNAIKVDTAGNCYIAGCFSATADFDPDAAVFSMSPPSVSPDIFVLKLDGSGNFIWAKQIGGIGHDIAINMTMDEAGNIYTVGSFGGTSDFDPGTNTYTLTATIESGFISKLDNSGNFVWAKQLAGTSTCYAKSTGLDTFGNLYVTGMFSGLLDADPGIGTYTLSTGGGADLFVLKLDTVGNFIWAKQFGGPFHDFVQGIAVDQVGNTYTTGYFQDTIDVDPGIGVFNLYNVTGYDIFILKLDSSGNFGWGKSIGGFSENIPNAIALDSACNIYTTGMFQGSSDFDPGSGVYTLMPVANYDQFISKLDSAGNFLWAVAMGGTGSENINAIVLDSTGNIHATGWFYGTGDFDPGAGIYSLTSVSFYHRDIFLGKFSQCQATSDSTLSLTACKWYVFNGQLYTATGSYTQSFSNAVGCDSIMTLNLTIFTVNTTVSQSGPVLTSNATGVSYNWVMCPSYLPVPGGFIGQSYTATANGQYAVIISKNGCTDTSACYQVTGIGLNEYEDANYLKVSPNPSKGLLCVRVADGLKNATITIMNSIGETVFRKPHVNGKQLDIDLSNQANGLYLLEIQMQDIIHRIKVMKE